MEILQTKHVLAPLKNGDTQEGITYLSVTTACFTCFVGVVRVDAVILTKTLAANAGAVAPLLRWNPHNMAQGENTPIQIQSTLCRGSKPLQQNVS
jgi:hypothetical protein